MNVPIHELRLMPSTAATRQLKPSKQGAPRTQAPGQYLGFSLQGARLLVRLAEAEPGTAVSLEVIDDVAVEHGDGSITAEQDKSAVGSGNPLGDTARDLWKTLSNWVDAVTAKAVDVQSTWFEVVVLQPKKAGKLVQAFQAATDQSSSADAVALARAHLWGPAPKHSKRSKVAATIKPYVENCFGDAKKEATLCRIIERFSYKVVNDSVYGDLDRALNRFPYPKDLHNHLTRGLVGWAKQETDMQIQRRQSARLTYEEFLNAYTNILTALVKQPLLTCMAPLPPVQVENELSPEGALKTYVRQLKIINCEDDDLIEAATNFLLAGAARTEWARQGFVMPESFTSLAKGMEATWRSTRRIREIEAKVHGYSPADQGQLVYSDCMKHSTILQGMDLPHFFIPGSFQVLADNELVGWHPDYRTELRK